VAGVKRLTIGRDPSCDFVVDDEYASNVHASLTQRDDGTVWLVDEGSVNGVWLNGHRVYEAPVRSGDRIKVGRTEVVVP
jgi:pSer/pThr/pTyr-binding forkhead associated (FHA) protein